MLSKSENVKREGVLDCGLICKFSLGLFNNFYPEGVSSDHGCWSLILRSTLHPGGKQAATGRRSRFRCGRAIAASQSSPVVFQNAIPSTRTHGENTTGWRSSPRCRWSALLGPRSKERSSRRAAACSQSRRDPKLRKTAARAWKKPSGGENKARGVARNFIGGRGKAYPAQSRIGSGRMEEEPGSATRGRRRKALPGGARASAG